MVKCGLLLFSHFRRVQFFVTPMDYSPPGSSGHGILQTKILEWVAISSPEDLPDPGIEPMSPALAGSFFTTEPPGKSCMYAKSIQSGPTLCDPMDCSPPGSSVHGILQVRIRVGCYALLQGIFPTQGSNPHLLCLLHWKVGSLSLVPPGKLVVKHIKCKIYHSNHFY